MDRLRVVQWATGNVGKAAIRHFAANPAFELVGAYVTDERKVGRDAGELAGIARLGVAATNDSEAILALDADCVHYAPKEFDLDVVCRLLASGKNVVSPLRFHYPTERYAPELGRLEAACRAGKSSYHGSGIHPGFAGDLMPLTLLRLSSRVDCVHVREYADLTAKTEHWPVKFGFGMDPDAVREQPGRSPESIHVFAQSMAMIVDGLGKVIETVTSRVELATASHDIVAGFGPVPAGSVSGMHFEWTAYAEGSPIIVYHSYWTVGGAADPDWGDARNRYEVEIEGDPPLRMTMEAAANHPSGDNGAWGLTWTAMAGVNAIRAVCIAEPGLVTHLDLGIVLPGGIDT